MLPTVDNLVKRKVNFEQGCKFCNNRREDIIHVFNDCAFSQEICRILTFQLTNPRTRDFRDLLEIRWNKLPPDKFEKWVISVWQLWHNRNLLVFGKPPQSTADIAKFEMGELDGFVGPLEIRPYLDSFQNDRDEI
ncbi:hypothetical protein LIER_18816 [Lithospermum erythrorhizon]|uniref:Reverse transcriptase zinc-binding domain-containing protein n=1 Tax=Lithospermum erythrorhizon TaxID=34254 RepID=A0AAV3QFD7_LITER